jgi:hypothetical protein
VAAIRTIRRLQEERFLPLTMIKQVLKGEMADLPAGAGAFPHLDLLLAQRLQLGGGDELVSLASLTKHYPQAASDAKGLAKLGAIELKTKNGKPHLDPLDARIVTLWGDIRKAGYTEATGFSPKDVDIYVAAVKLCVPVEVERFYSRLAGRFGQEEAAERAQAGVEIINALIGALRTRFIMRDVTARNARASRRRR